MSGTAGRRTAPGLYFPSALTAALPALTKNLALKLGPIRVNLIAAMFRAHRLPMMDSSSRSVEKMSTVILQTLHKQ